MTKMLFALTAVIMLSGCALTTATLDLDYDPDTARRGPLSAVAPTKVALGDFRDKRVDTARIGYKKNTYGMNTADILSDKPVVEIVRSAIATALEANGREVGEGSPRRIEGDVTKFWFDMQLGFWTIQFMGTVDCTLRVFDETSSTDATPGQDAEPLYDASYTGHYNEKSMGGLKGSWERVMNQALARMVESIVFDAELANALTSEEAAPPSETATPAASSVPAVSAPGALGQDDL